MRVTGGGYVLSGRADFLPVDLFARLLVFPDVFVDLAGFFFLPLKISSQPLRKLSLEPVWTV